MAIFENELLGNKIGPGDETVGPKPILESPTPSVPNTFTASSNLFGFENPGNTGLTIDQMGSIATKQDKMGTWTSPTQMVPRSELMANSRYPIYERGVDLENIYGLQQGWTSQIANGVVKMGATALGTFAQSLSNIPNAISAAKSGNFKDLSGNPNGYEGAIDGWLKNLEDSFPNYATKYERDHPFMSMIPFHRGFANFVGDKFIKNLGFTAGAIAGAAAQDVVLGMATEGIADIPLVANQVGKAALYLNKLFTGTTDVEKALLAAKGAGTTAETILNIEKLGQLAAYTKVGNGFKYGAALLGSAMTEAGVEGRDGYNQVRKELIDQYTRTHGEAPEGAAAAEIEKYATDAMNVRFGINMALLTVSNAIQFDNLFKSFTTAGKSVTGSLTRELEDVGKIGLKEGSLDQFEKKATTGVTSKIWDSVKPQLGNILAEGVYEEGGQYAAERGTYNYYTRKYKDFQDPEKRRNWNDLNEAIKSTTYGLNEQFGTAEGIENMVIGALTAVVTGGVQHRIDNSRGQGKDERLQTAINILNQYGLTGVLSNKYANTLDSVGIANEMERAAKSGNVYDYKNLQHDMFYNYVTSRLPIGMHDVTIEQLKMLKELNKEDFEKTFGMDFNTSNKANVEDYVDSMIKEANRIKGTYDSINNTFKNPFKRYENPQSDEESEEQRNWGIFEDWKDNLGRYASKIPYINDRLGSIQESVSKVNGLINNELLAKLTDTEALQDLSKSYEEKAKSLDKTITDYTSTEDKRAIKDQIKALRTQSEKINLAINAGTFDLKNFNQLLNFELNNQDPKAENVIPLDKTKELHDFGHDINRLNNLRTTTAKIFDVLSSKEGFEKFFKQADEVSSENIEEQAAEPVKAQDASVPTFTNNIGDKEPVDVGREYQIDKSELAKVSKIDDGRWKVTAPNGDVTFHPTEEAANEAAEEANQEAGDLAKVKVLAVNPDGTVKVEDLAGNITNIPVNKLSGYQKIETQQEKLRKFSDQVDKDQQDIEKTSGEVSGIADPTPAPLPEGKQKDANFLFDATTSEEETDNFVPKPHQARAIEFLNTAESHPDYPSMKAILVTINQEDSLGLKGLARISFNVSEEEAGTDEFKSMATNLDDGLIAAVYVKQVGSDLYFVDKEGNTLTKVGETADMTKIVFNTMPTTSLKIGERNRYRSNQEELAKAKAAAWKIKRDELFKADGYTAYSFTVSRGIPSYSDQKNNVGEVLVPQDKISTQENLIQISTTGTINFNGKTIEYGVGKPVLTYGSVIQPLSGRTFSRKQAQGVTEVLKKVSEETKRQLVKGEPIKINRLYSNYLQNVLYWRSKPDATGLNQIYINTQTMDLVLGGRSFDLTNIADQEDAVVDTLMGMYQNINRDTLANKFHDKFYEPHIGPDGKLTVSEWTNYQSYLLSNTYPDGSARSINDVPLYTNVAKPSSNVPYAFRQKYAVLQGLDLPVQTVEKREETMEEEAPKIAPITLEKTQVFEHGEDSATKEGKENGIKDTTLTEKGREYARLLGEHVAEAGKTTVVSSDVARAKETAQVAVDEANRILDSSDIEAKKADIERRRKEELKKETNGLETATKGDKGIFWTQFKGKRQDYEIDREVEVEAVSKNGVKFKGDKDWTNFKEYYYFKNITKEQQINAKYDAELAALEGGKAKVTHVVNPLLNTWNVGEFDGKQAGTFDEVYWANHPDQTVEGGESFKDFTDRMVEAYEFVEAAPASDQVITHSKVTRAFKALRATDGKWTDETTKKFLEEKEKSIPTSKYVLDGVTKNIVELKNGPISFTAVQDASGKYDIAVDVNDTVNAIASNKETLAIIIDALKKEGEFDATKSNVDLVAQFLAIRTVAELQADKKPNVVKQEEAPKEEKKVTPEDFSDTANPDDSQYRKAGVTPTSRISAGELELFKQWHAKNVPNIPFEVLDNIITTHDGEQAWGAFEKGVAKFYRGGERGTEYHEIFHGIFNGFLSADDRKAILDEFKAKPGKFKDRASGKMLFYEEATDQQAEERIADDFSDFRLGKLPARSLGEKILKFFRNIIQFVKDFVNKPSRKEELFKAIEAGKFKEATLNTAVVGQMTQYRMIPGLTPEQTNDFVQDITARIFRNVFGTNTSLFNPEKITGKEMFDNIKAQYDKEGKFQLLGEARWEDLIKKTKEFLRTFKIEFDENDMMDINDENYNNRLYAPEPFSTDWKKTSAYPVKLLIGTLSQTEPGSQKVSGVLTLPKTSFSKTINGLKLVNFSRAFATVMDRLSNTTKTSDFVNKLSGLATDDADYVRLFTRLKGNLDGMVIDFSKFEPHDWRLFVNFYKTFSKQKPDALVQYIAGDEVYSAPANIFTSIKQTQNSWIENIKAMADTPDAIIKKVGNMYKVGKVSGIDTSNPTTMLTFLNRLGVNISMDEYLNIKNIDAFKDQVDSIKKYLVQNKNIYSVTGKTLGINGPLTKLAEMIVKVNNPIQESTFANVEGEKTQTYADNNAPSSFKNDFNSVGTLTQLKEERPELKDVFSTNSVTLKPGGLFFDVNGKRIKSLGVSYIGGTKEEEADGGSSTASLTLGNRFTQEINQNLNGRYNVLIPADGSTEWMMDMGNYISYVEVEGGLAWDKVYTVFQGYLRDEIALAQSNRKYLANTAPRAQELRFFKDILGGAILRDVNNLILNKATQEEIDVFFKDKKNIEDINGAVYAFIDKKVNDTIDILKNNKKVVFSKDNKSLIYSDLDGTFANKEEINKNKLSDKQLKDVITFARMNYVINNTEFHKVLFGDPYQFAIKDGLLDETKRIKSFLSPRGTTFVSSEFDTAHNQLYNTAGEIKLLPGDPGYHTFKPYVDTVTFRDVNIKGFYDKTNEGDAASWIMDTTFREVKLKNGQWIEEEAEPWHQWQMAYTRNKLAAKGQYEYTNDKLKAQDAELISKPAPEYVIDVLKPVVSGNKYGRNQFDLVLDKFSQMPLYYSQVEGTNLEKLYVKLWKEGVGYTVMGSGRKVGAEKIYDIYKDGEFNDEPYTNKVPVAWKTYGIQVENAYAGEKKQTRGSQLTKLASLDIFDNGKATSELAQKAYTRNLNVLNALHVEEYNKLLNRLGIIDLGTSFKLPNKVSVSQALQREMLRREMAENDKDVLQLDENGEFRIPFEASPAYIKIRNILYSMVDKALVRPKMNGGPKVQVPVTLWEDYDSKRTGGPSEKLKFYTKDAPYCEILVPHWFKDQFAKAGFKSDEELLAYLNRPENEKILRGIGFRIPTQALSSAEVFKVKGFLPQSMGDTVVVPSEITTKAGSDFDIDKLNMYLKNTYVTSKGELKQVPFFGYGEEAKEKIKRFILEQDLANMLDINSRTVFTAEDDYDTIAEKLYKQSLENEYFDSLEEMLTLPENFERLTTPVTDGGLKKIATRLNFLRGEDETNIKGRMLDPNYLTNLRHAFVMAKKWVGIGAVNVTNHSLAQKAEIYIDPAMVAKLSDYERKFILNTYIALPHNTITINGKQVTSISGTKDVDGKAYISDSLSGYITSFVDVAKDPYITSIIPSNTVVSTFMFLQRIGVPTATVAVFMNQPIIKEYLSYLDSIDSKNVFAKRNLDYIRSKFPTKGAGITSVTMDVKKLAENIKDYYANKKLDATRNKEQHTILDEFLKYHSMAQYMFRLTQATNYDTTKFKNGDSFAKKQARTQKARQSNIFNSVDNILNKSFIGEQANLLDNMMDAMGEILVLEKPEFSIITKTAISPYLQNEYLANDKFDKIADKAKASFVDYIIQTKSKLNSEIEALMVNPETAVATKLAEAKKNHPEVKMLQYLTVDSSNITNGAKSIKLVAKASEAYDQNLYVGYMEEMRDNPATKDLYNDIVKLALLQGTYDGGISIQNIIPVDDYSKSIKEIFNTLSADKGVNMFAKTTTFQKNNWKDEDIVPTIKIKTGPLDFETLGEFMAIDGLTDNTNKDILLLDQYNYFKEATNEVVKIKRFTPYESGWYDVITGNTLTKTEYKDRKAAGDPILGQVIGYQKVRDILDNPITTPSPIKNSELYVYRRINLLGDGRFTTEHYEDARKSIIENGTYKSDFEISEKNIIDYFTNKYFKESVPSQSEDKEVKPEDLPAIKDNNQNNCG